MTSLRLATTRCSPRRPSRALDSSVPCNPGPRARPPPRRPRHPCRDDTRSTIIGSPGSRRHEEAHAAATGCGGTSCAAGPIGSGQFRGEAVRARVVADVVVTPLRPPLLCVWYHCKTTLRCHCDVPSVYARLPSSDSRSPFLFIFRSCTYRRPCELFAAKDDGNGSRRWCNQEPPFPRRITRVLQAISCALTSPGPSVCPFIRSTPS